MQDRPVIVERNNNVGMFAIVAIIAIAAIALFVWQPWNATAGPNHTTTVINQQPAGDTSGASGSGSAGSTSGTTGSGTGSSK